ncbi:OmpW/AlkL family protein [Parahaliea mediterranea]|uniref:OmpW/AlkL family protein n=1 Tax=Parahaliea mediterranea TaxID=651086 RepID=UPI000E2E6558|nr:OmpW family outer membrane protein [Parahaliea mediterranea]
MQKCLRAALGGCLLVAAVPALAYEAGDVIVRVGAATVNPREDSEQIVLPTSPSPTVLPGVGVDGDTQLGLGGAYLLTPSLGIELLAATPFEHDVKVQGLGIEGGSVSHLPPTLSLQWYPRGAAAGWQPYLGIGINYTVFFDEDVSSELKGALQATLGASRADLALENSVGLAGQVGVDIPLNDNLMLNAAVWYIDIDTEAAIRTDVGTVKFDLDIDPWVYSLGLAWRF